MLTMASWYPSAAGTTPACSAARPTSRSTTSRAKASSSTATGTAASIVFDSETGAYKRHWGAYGNKPERRDQSAHDPVCGAAATVR